MSALLKTTHVIHNVGVKSSSILHTLANKAHASVINLHTAAFWRARQKLATRHAKINLRLQDNRDKHLARVNRLCEEFEQHVVAAKAAYDAKLADANKAHSDGQLSLIEQAKSTSAKLEAVRKEHSAFNA